MIKRIFNKLQKYRAIITKVIININHYIFLRTDYDPQINKKYKTKDKTSNKSLKISHIATFSRLNSGDTLLPVCVKDSISKNTTLNIKWESIQIGLPYTKRHIKILNSTKGIIIGGGGLFINRRDPNTKHPTGWHWNCSTQLTKQIEVPIAFFAIGYNQFRESGNMSNKFKTHINSLSNNLKFIGMRNNGSIDKIKEYLNINLHDKIKFQPCPTTIISNLYPKLLKNREEYEHRVIGINCAFDRPEKRYNNNLNQICNSIALSLKYLSKKYTIRCYIHSPSDAQIIYFLKKHKISHQVSNLVNKSPEQIIKSYLNLDLMLGMRGHSQMIPFGCRVPIISLISHNKLKYFLDDIDQKQWGIEVSSDSLKNDIINKANEILSKKNSIIDEIDEIQTHFISITKKNSNHIINNFLE